MSLIVMPSMRRRSRMIASCVEPGQIATFFPFRSLMVLMSVLAPAMIAMPPLLALATIIAGEPVMIVASANNGGMAIMAGANTDIKTIKDLKGKKVAIWPGSTQEAIILERLRMEGMTIKDIQPIRLSFSDMAGALARGDIDAYVGA